MFLFWCLTLTLGDVVWTESIIEDTTIISKNNVSEPSRTGWSFTDNNNAFILYSSFNSEKFVLSNYDYRNEADYYLAKIVFDSSPPNLKSFQLKFWNNNTAVKLYANHFYNDFQLSIGCFDDEIGCTSIAGFWNIVFAYTSSFTVFGSNVSQRIAVNYDYIVNNTFSYPFIYIDGIASQSIAFRLNFFTL
ncbi:hypothetical protein QTN25_010022 [Entamoeba marina]